jgi:hypothetical protein
VYKAQLRAKLEPDPAHPRHLLTEPGDGISLRSRSIDGANSEGSNAEFSVAFSSSERGSVTPPRSPKGSTKTNATTDCVSSALSAIAGGALSIDAFRP